MTYRDLLGFESPGPESEIFHAPRKISYYSRLVNHKQRAFVAHYLATLNAAEAARRAGYSERRAKQTGSELLANPGVRAAIDAEFAGLIPSAAESPGADRRQGPGRHSRHRSRTGARGAARGP